MAIMPISFTPMHPVIGAECSGVDISRPLTREEAEAIDAGMDRYAVLFFRQGTPLTTDQQVAFTRDFGDLEPPYTQIKAAGGNRLDSPALSDISNLGPNGGILDRDDRTTMHRARRYDDEIYPRDLRRTTLTDGVPTVEQQLSTAA